MKKLISLSFCLILSSILIAQDSKFNIFDIFSTNKKTEKDWTFMVYITSNNDLYEFSELNLKQMATVGSNDNLNIIAQQDSYGKQEIKRLFIKKNNTQVIETITNKPECISGTPNNLFNFAQWAIKNYPAKQYALILWDHGSGIIDPNIWKYNPANLYILNPETGLYELNRAEITKRGICFNEVFEVYLKNQDLKLALSRISKELLNNNKLDILGMDACNMAMLEVGCQIKDSVKIMVGSEETEPGTGWNYQTVLTPLLTKKLNPQEFATQIVNAYQASYEKNYSDFTQSAVNLEKINFIEISLNKISEELINLLSTPNRPDILRTIKRIRSNKKYTTSFANADYIDLGHFLTSLKDQMNKKLILESYKEEYDILKNLLKNIEESQIILDSLIINKTICKSILNTTGLSFYFPTRKIHESYFLTDFAKTNKWLNFLKVYLIQK
ncbi:MAG: Clostripain family protease [candidate division TM6 bacterium GW2011_GWF2_28_16]|nr:MAG: Clostripain family protease [candidate division TM6 bacterium GW2011_GWF2_28_16]